MTQGQAGMPFPITRGGISEAGNLTPVQVHVTGTKNAPETSDKVAPKADGEPAPATSPEATGAEVIGPIDGGGLPYTAENADFGGGPRPEPGPPKFIGREGPNPTPLSRLQQNHKAPDTGIGIQKKKS